MRPAPRGTGMQDTPKSLTCAIFCIRLRALGPGGGGAPSRTPFPGASVRGCACPGSVRALTARDTPSEPSRVCGGRARGHRPARPPSARPAASAQRPQSCPQAGLIEASLCAKARTNVRASRDRPPSQPPSPRCRPPPGARLTRLRHRAHCFDSVPSGFRCGPGAPHPQHRPCATQRARFSRIVSP